MLTPSMQELMKKVGNRYLLVNLAAQRARDIAAEAEAEDRILEDKPVKLALDEIVNGTICYVDNAKTVQTDDQTEQFEIDEGVFSNILEI